MKTALAILALLTLVACGKQETARAENDAPTVAVAKAARQTIERKITLSAELVPFQETDVYAKVSGFVKQLFVDYGTRVKAGQVMAVLEIPELEVQLRQDDAMTKNASDRVVFAEHEVTRAEAQHKVQKLQYERLAGVIKNQPGLVAQQEVDDAQGKFLASQAAVDSAKANLQASQSDLVGAKARREHDQVLFDYSKITAPFTGVITQRYANQGTLMQAGTNSSTQATPLVRMSQDDVFRLVIPVPESYVRFIHIGGTVQVRVPSLNRSFPGTVARFSSDVKEDTRTMHTEVSVANSDHVLISGLYAETDLTLEKKDGALVVPLQAVNRSASESTLFVVDAANKLQTRRVTLGLQTAANVEVLSGVAEGDMVVTGDRGGLKAGQTVRPKITETVEFKEP